MIEKKKIVRLELLMDAGFGSQTIGDILIKAFAKSGKYVFIESMIPSEISPPPRTKPALSGVIIRVADFELTNIGSDTDLMLAAHEIVLDRRLDDGEENPHCRIILDMGDKTEHENSYERVCKRITKAGLHTIPFEIDEASKTVVQSLGGKGKNLFYLGMLSSICNISQSIVIQEIQKTFSNKLKKEILEKNIQLFEHGYQFAKKEILFSYEIEGSHTSGDKILIDGNSALTAGIINAGIKLYTSYPITPASSIMHILAKEFASYGGMVYQAEDEIAAIGTAIGAYFGGFPSITCTSGPGLSLKQEFIGFASAAEVPAIIIDVQRAGPSTGMPTKTEQSDLLAVINGSHGDNTKIVISVANMTDCFYAPQLARYLAEKLRLPVFIISDFQMANSYKVINKPQISKMENIGDINDFVLERFYIQRLPDNIDMVCANQSSPGTSQIRRVTGLNTDETGSVNYFSKANHRSHAVRNEKLHIVNRALKKPEMFGAEEGDLLIVGWGSSRGSIEEAVNICNKEESLSISGLHLKIVYPLPLVLKEIFSKFKQIATAEVAYGDHLKPAPLATLLRVHTCLNINSVISKATGRPITPKMIITKAKEILKVQ